MNHDQIKSNLIVYLLRVRCKKCFKPFSKESFWQFPDDTDKFSFSNKDFFDVNKRPISDPLTSNVKFIYDRYHNNIWSPVVREAHCLTKQISHSKYKTVIVHLFCSSCSETRALEYIVDR